jgi:hypothetical protein
MARNTDRKLIKQAIKLLHNRYDTPDLSPWQFCIRVLRNGPEMVGTEILTREQAYIMLWTMIFNQHKRDNKFPKK